MTCRVDRLISTDVLFIFFSFNFIFSLLLVCRIDLCIYTLARYNEFAHTNEHQGVGTHNNEVFVYDSFKYMVTPCFAYILARMRVTIKLFCTFCMYRELRQTWSKLLSCFFFVLKILWYLLYLLTYFTRTIPVLD